jgi:hypothetical protein
VRRYNKTALEALKKATRHIHHAELNLAYGILQSDFKEEIKTLNSIRHTILNVILEEE